MKKTKNQVTYGVACACEDCQRKSGRDFEILTALYDSLQEARKDLKDNFGPDRTDHSPVFLVRETIEPLHQIPRPKS